MRKRFFLLLAVLILFVMTLGVGKIVYDRRGIPFVRETEQWSIGIYSGTTPFDFPERQRLWNPVLRAEDVTDVPAKFVADPFLVQDDETWFLFFEVYNLASKHGDIAIATSTNTRNWKYEQVVLDEPFHLSYPYVFKWEDDYDMIPEYF